MRPFKKFWHFNENLSLSHDDIIRTWEKQQIGLDKHIILVGICFEDFITKMPSISAMNTVVPLEIIEVQEFNSANADT